MWGWPKFERAKNDAALQNRAEFCRLHKFDQIKSRECSLEAEYYGGPDKGY